MTFPMAQSGLGLFRTARRSGRSLSGHAEICASRLATLERIFQALVFRFDDRKEVIVPTLRAGVARPVRKSGVSRSAGFVIRQ